MAQIDSKHVDSTEALEAEDPTVGDGNRVSAPHVSHVDEEYVAPTSWVPTRKWWSATAIAAGTVATLLSTHGGHWDEHTSIPIIGLVVQRAVSYFTPNEEVV